MPESRDRLSRAVDIAELFAHRRHLGIYQDLPELEMALRSPLSNSATRTGAAGFGAIAGRGRGGFGTPRGQNRRGRSYTYVSPVAVRENTPTGSARRPRGRGARASNSMLPSWYPRTPLRDITAVMRAIERRRERLGASGGQQIGSPMPRGHTGPDFPEPTSVADLEQNNSSVSPVPTLRLKRCHPSVGTVQKILLDITNQASGDAESLTPQRKLLNSMDTVEKVVMEELQKLKRTPTAKREEREKRVRTLMSMR